MYAAGGSCPLQILQPSVRAIPYNAYYYETYCSIDNLFHGSVFLIQYLFQVRHSFLHLIIHHSCLTDSDAQILVLRILFLHQNMLTWFPIIFQAGSPQTKEGLAHIRLLLSLQV